MSYRIPDALIAEENARRTAALAEDYAALGRQLARAGVDIEAVTAKVAAFAVAVPTWGVGTGGTRFARFPGSGEPRDMFDKLEDCATSITHARDADLLAAFPVGQGRRLSRARANSPRRSASASTRSIPTPSRISPAKSSPTSSARCPQPEGRARPGGRAQCRVHRDRREARLEGADGLDRRRLQFPRPIESQPRASTGISSR